MFSETEKPKIVVMTAEDFKSILNDLAQRLFQHKQEEEAEIAASKKAGMVYLTRKEAADKLHVDLSTLWRWDKRGYLPSVKMGGKVVYLPETIEEFMSRNQRKFSE